MLLIEKDGMVNDARIKRELRPTIERGEMKVIRGIVVHQVIILWCASVGASCAAARCTKGSEFEPPLCPLHLQEVSKVTIVENAAKSPAEQDKSVACDSFLIDEKHVRRYLARAMSTTESDAHHTLDWSPCYASGKITFSDGRTGEWTLDQFRQGSLVMDNEKKTVLYCPDCKFKPFQW